MARTERNKVEGEQRGTHLKQKHDDTCSDDERSREKDRKKGRKKETQKTRQPNGELKHDGKKKERRRKKEQGDTV